jgi:hypothetical protein
MKEKEENKEMLRTNGHGPKRDTDKSGMGASPRVDHRPIPDEEFAYMFPRMPTFKDREEIRKEEESRMRRKIRHKVRLQKNLERIDRAVTERATAATEIGEMRADIRKTMHKPFEFFQFSDLTPISEFDRKFVENIREVHGLIRSNTLSLLEARRRKMTKKYSQHGVTNAGFSTTRRDM